MGYKNMTIHSNNCTYIFLSNFMKFWKWLSFLHMMRLYRGSFAIQRCVTFAVAAAAAADDVDMNMMILSICQSQSSSHSSKDC